MKIGFKNGGFTFTELIIVTFILAILATIGFSSFVGNISYSRDAERTSDFSQVLSSMKLYNKNKGSYPIPENYFSITNGGGSNVVVWQGKLGTSVGLSTIDDIPFDPEANIPYLYSITKNKGEFQIAGTLENGGDPKAIVMGSYKSIAKNVLPTIVLAGESSGNVEITDSSNKNLFIFDGQGNNLPYLFDGTNSPVSKGVDFDVLLSQAESFKTFSQNSSFETCEEIRESGKSIGNGEYQLRSSTGALLNTICSGM